MLLLEPGHTAYDLHWRMFGIGVRVHPAFWLISAIFGFSYLSVSIPAFLVCVACMFFSILIHELGHVFMFRVFGTQAHIVLYAFGGLAIPQRGLYNRWQRIAVSFAGPLAEFLLVAAILATLAVADPEAFQVVGGLVLSMFGIRLDTGLHWDLPPLVGLAIVILVEINIYWGLLNLLPIWPLDGGHICRDFLDGVMRRGGARLALKISLVLAAVLAIHSIASSRGYHLIPFLPSFGMYMAMMFAMLAVQSYQLLEQESNTPWRREG